MKSKQEHRHAYNGSDDSVVEVLQGDVQVATQCDEIFTEGLGPCIGVAFSFQGRGYMFHDAGIHHCDFFEAFLAKCCTHLSAVQRRSIRPIVAGGDSADDDDVLSSRAFCLEQLSASGFGAPKEVWNRANGVQAIYLDVHKDTVRVHTQTSDFATGSKESVVELQCS